ncbi:TauD/TfdA family dioxygenase [Brasilonema sp. CT11]|nr:TauD/TfdA family dioxygenase [Brasilonema sp. CT11]
MLFETLYYPGSGIHIDQVTCAFYGNLDRSAFQRAWQQVVERHSILRTAFVWKDQEEPLQVVLRQVEVLIEEQDWRNLSASEQQEQLEVYLNVDNYCNFNLSKPPLMRLALFQMADDTYQLVWTRHHILMDGWCQPIVFNEFLSFYQAFSKGQNLQLKPSRPYRDYIAWLKKQDLSKAEEFWRNTLQGFTKPTPLGIPADSDSFFEQEEHSEEQRTYLPLTATAALQSLTQQHHLTLNTLIQGVWALLLSRYSDEQDVVFGITVSGRSADLTGIESMVGLFINTLPMRVKVFAEASLWAWLTDIQTYNQELRQYEYSPGGQVHQWSEVPGILPLYESILVFENYPVDLSTLQFSDLTIDIRQARFKGAQTKYPLTLLVTPGSELMFRLVYDGHRLDRANINLILEHFLTLLKSIIAEPEQNLTILLDKIPANQIPRIRPVQKFVQQELGKVFLAPRTSVEEILANIWAQVLNVKQVGIDDNFFELGGHSLLATQLNSRIRDTFQLELPLRYLFETPTVAGLAASIETLRREKQNWQAPSILPTSENRDLPLSFAQQRLWFQEQLNPGTSTYNTPAAVHLTGKLDVLALEQSLNEIIRRHKILQTTFATVHGQPVQIIAPTYEQVSNRLLPLPVIDVQNLHDDQQDVEVRRLAIEEAVQPLDLIKGTMWRVMLVRLRAAEYVVLLTMHHIVSDAWTMGVFIRELAALYQAFCAGKPSPLPELPIQYADFAVWQRQRLQGEVLEAQLTYWKQQLGNNLPVLQLPTTCPRTEVKTNRGATQSFLIPSKVSQGLQALSRQEGVTLFMTLLAGFQVLLQRYTSQDDIVVGTDVANRNQAETESLIGFFVNLLVLRTDLSGNPTFGELLKRVRSVALGAYAHQDLPFEELVKALQPERNLSNTPPLFQVLFVLQNAPMPPLELPGLTLSLLEIEHKITRFDFGLFLTETEQGILCKWQYNADLFDTLTITRMARHFQTLLNSIISQSDARLSNLEMLTSEERKQQVMQKKERKAFNREKFISIAPKAVSLSQEKWVVTDYLQPGQTFPLVIHPADRDLDLVAWAKTNREFIETELLKHGAILFRGFNVDSVSEFESVAQAICPDLFGEYGDLPRAGESGKVYGSTPYPPDKAILFHNESSHLHQWPLKIWFFCVQPAQKGGDTPIVDCRKAYQLLTPKLRERLAQKQFMYVRNYTNGLDVSWQDFFRTNDKSEVENYCRKTKIDFEWYDNNGLITRQVRPALAVHQKTGEPVFFNQIQLHHIAYLDAEVRESLLSTFGDKKLPRNVYYGDGTPIQDEVIGEINEVYQQSQISFPWQQGDILMLDNMLTAHGRNSYLGYRKIVVAMGEMIKEQ